ncbi:MAG: DUF2726 domain-containing protein [Acidobacteriota bacterium]
MAIDPVAAGWVVLALTAGGLIGWLWRGARDQSQRRSWPRQWNLNARPVFTVHERALFRELKAALPQHVLLAKIGLLRFCHSGDNSDAKAWYERLHPLHVSMAICTPNGVVVSVIDVDHNGKSQTSQRNQRLKEAVLDACRIRYIRCLPGQWPQANLLAAWALGQAGAPAAERAPVIQDELHSVGHQLASKLKQRRAERSARWSESGFSQDSFFAFDSRYDNAGAANSMPGALEDFQDTQPNRTTNEIRRSQGSN